MDKRDKEVLNMQLTLIPILAKAWKKSYSELSDIFTSTIYLAILMYVMRAIIPWAIKALSMTWKIL